VQVKAVTFIYVAAPPLLASAAAVMNNFESVERRLIFHDFLHTLFYKHVLASRTLYVIWGRRYKGRCIVVASSQHLYVTFGQMLRRTCFVAETDHRPDLGRYYGDVNSWMWWRQTSPQNKLSCGFCISSRLIRVKNLGVEVALNV